ncbi:MAG TPA: hypothetical protein VHM25_11700 [Polyangiaceae bacterium]|jgi:hypothetical protein|nr:hypothetical protein [Polyangiaceae bacterium]
MLRPTTLTLCSLWALLAALGCGSTSDPAGQPDTTPAVCEAHDYHVESEAIEVKQVHATLQVPSGEPAADLPVQVCGIDTCLNFKADDNGVLSVAPAQKMLQPAFKYGDGFDFAELAAPLTANNQSLGKIIALPLPTLSEGAKFPRSGAVTNGDVTLRLASNVRVEHDVLTYTDDEIVLRSVEVPVADSPQALPPGFGFELAYGLAPLGSTFCPAAGLSVKNTQSWAPGTEVEVFVQGLDVSEKSAPYGTWLQVAEARVSSDGKSIDTTSGGIPILSSIALRRK